MLMPRNDPDRPVPLDHPTPQRAHRLYFALTNHCNRACPWCSTCSSPRGKSWLSLENYTAAFPTEGRFQVQLEGGEPTLHPRFWDFVRIAREHPRCEHLVLCTNGVVLPRGREDLRHYIARLGVPLTLKLSVNHYLLDHDKSLIDLAVALREAFAEMNGDRTLVVNVRLRRGIEDDDRRVAERVVQAGLLPVANIFYLQRYGFAANHTDWEPPAPVWNEFSLINPDGQIFGPDLIARSEAMRVLP
ncbi:MAG TPA: radical SAM protein [Bryobacteraceae bacterium]|jgi:MoaA/NifB/PqqE/SkfB family radical SAM enzyme